MGAVMTAEQLAELAARLERIEQLLERLVALVAAQDPPRFPRAA